MGAVIPWTDAELDALHANYPNGGVEACLPMIPNRSKFAIKIKANHENLFVHGKGCAGSPVKKDAWAVPQHDYAPEDHAARGWRYPVDEPIPFRVTLAGMRMLADV